MSPFISILKSIFFTALISAIISLFFINVFWQAFAITTAAQIVIFFIINAIRDVSLAKIETAKIAELSKQGLLLKCPCYKQNEEFIPIELNENNSYTCRECNKSISVNIEATTLISTVPLDLENSQNNLEKIYSTITNGN